MSYDLENEKDHDNFKTLGCIINTIIYILKDALKLMESLQRRLNGLVKEVKE